MRILINGYHWGGNTPPFVAMFKKLGHEVKLICPGAFSTRQLLKQHKLDKTLKEEDLILPSYSKLEELAIRALRKMRCKKLSLLFMANKVKKTVKTFRPDIIYNHTFSRSTYLMLKTGFKPQVSFPFGTDVMGPKAYKDYDMHQEIVKGSEYIISALPAATEFFIKKLNVPPNKIPAPIPIGLPDLHKILEDQSKKGQIVRKKYSLPVNKMIMIETRGLRRTDGGTIALLKAVKRVNHDDIYLILTKGFLGKSAVVEQAKSLIKDLSLTKKVKIIEDELDYDEVLGLYNVSDINLSLLPHDGLGKSIMEAISQKCQLILTDLPDYRIAFEDNAEYVKHDNIEDIAISIDRTISLSLEIKEQRLRNNLRWLKTNQCFETNCKKLIELFEQVVIKTKNI